MNDVWWMTAIRENVVMKGAQPMNGVPEYVLTPASVIQIVCDADYWTKSRAKSGNVREKQHAIKVSWLQFMPYVTAEKDPTLPRVII